MALFLRLVALVMRENDIVSNLFADENFFFENGVIRNLKKYQTYENVWSKM